MDEFIKRIADMKALQEAAESGAIDLDYLLKLLKATHEFGDGIISADQLVKKLLEIGIPDSAKKGES